MRHDTRGARVAAGAALLVAIAGGALAQSDAPAEVPANPAPPGTLESPPEQVRPGPPIGSPGGSGSTGGVIVPPSGTDPGLVREPPDGGAATTPVIPPPGTPGGDPSVVPR